MTCSHDQYLLSTEIEFRGLQCVPDARVVMLVGLPGCDGVEILTNLTVTAQLQ